MYYGIKKIVDKIYQKFPFDIIHAHVALPDGWAGMRIAVKYKKSLIVTIHGQDFYKTIFRNKRCKESIEKVINFSNKTIVVSNKLRKIGRQNLDISSGKMRVIFNGIDLEELLTIKNHEPLLKCKNKKVILTVGYLIKRKAHRYVIKALTRLALKHPDIIYLIAGDGPEEKNLKKLVKEEKLEKFVKFLGRINHQEVMTLMRSCDIFVLPSWDEAFGVVYIEAMASGKPVIACKGQGITDVIKDGETGLLVKPKDVDSLVKAIDFLLSHPEEAKKMGERAKKLVLENYTWEKNAEKTIKVYKEVVGGR
jgi:glycosyltransferase involved in cell wall biosynthesis